MVVDMARWCSAPGVAPFLLVMRYRRSDAFQVGADAAAACDLKLRRWSIQTPNALILSVGATWVSYSLIPVWSWFLARAVVGAIM